MSNLSPFGHFFAFTATVNFATSIFSTFSTFLSSLLSQFEVDRLSKERVFHVQAHELYKTTFLSAINHASEQERSNLILSENKGKILLLEAENAEIRAKNFVDEINNSISYKNNFECKFMPLFPLAGTYSLIFLFFAAFSEAHEPDDIICFNTILFLNIWMLTLSVGNYFNWFYLKGKSKNFRTIILNSLLIVGTFLCWLLALLVHSSKDFQWVNYTPTIERNIIISFLFLSGIGFIALLFKMVRINFIAWRRFQKFKKSNDLLKQYLERVKPK